MKVQKVKNWQQFLNENLNPLTPTYDTTVLNDLYSIIVNLLNTYGLRYVNEEDLDQSNILSLPKMMTDKRGHVKYGDIDGGKFFYLYFPLKLKTDIIKTIGENNFNNYFTFDNRDEYLAFKIRTYKKDNKIVSHFITYAEAEERSILDVNEVEKFITDLTNHVISLPKKEWDPTKSELEQGLKNLRNI
jgi:hypothetical protein